MNRRQRRSTAKASRRAPPEHPQREERAQAPTLNAAARPGLLLRLFASVVLAPWILKRVNHADVERLLAGVAVQAGRPEIATNLRRRIALRNEGGA